MSTLEPGEKVSRDITIGEAPSARYPLPQSLLVPHCELTFVTEIIEVIEHGIPKSITIIAKYKVLKFLLFFLKENLPLKAS